MLSTAQLQPFRSNKTCFGWPETALDIEHEEEACGMKSSDPACQWQQETILHVNRPQHKWKKNSKKWQWETGLQINPFAKLIPKPGLMEVQRRPWAQLWQVSAGDQREIMFLKLFGACSSCHEDQGHADLHPGKSQNHIKYQAPTTHKCCTRLVLGWLTRGILQLFHTVTL